MVVVCCVFILVLICIVFLLSPFLSFRYAAQLPQIMKGVGIECFLTQKLSWNQTNKFPHTTFIWEGLDGSRVLTHFPPADTYNSHATVKEVLFSVSNHKDKGRADDSMLLFGHGDGGGGPQCSMLESLSRMQDVAGLPKVSFSGPEAFFDILKKKHGDQLTSGRIAKGDAGLCVWRGELYFEYHRGTYTSQAKTKYNNRRCEEDLARCELLGCLLLVSGGGMATPLVNSESCLAAEAAECAWTKEELVSRKIACPRSRLSWCWKRVLLNQFHDVIPGSSIQQVYRDVDEIYKTVRGSLSDLEFALVARATATSPSGLYSYNPLSWEVKKNACVDMGFLQRYLSSDAIGRLVANKKLQVLKSEGDGKTERGLVVLPAVPPCGSLFVPLSALEGIEAEGAQVEVSVNKALHMVTLRNRALSAVFDTKTGRLVSLVHLETGRETVDGSDDPDGRLGAGIGHRFAVYDDVPLAWGKKGKGVWLFL